MVITNVTRGFGIGLGLGNEINTRAGVRRNFDGAVGVIRALIVIVALIITAVGIIIIAIGIIIST